MINRPPFFFVFDVESIGLHGEGFAFGIHIMTSEGTPVDDVLAWVNPLLAQGSPDSGEWVSKNVPEMPINDKFPDLEGLRNCFWNIWLIWKEKGAMMVADCSWPVEARFLAACVDQSFPSREWEGPYPLHDLASILWALGKDPMATNERLTNELPQHNPLCDARQSARLLVEALGKEGS
jgi:hypothetical protein